MGTLEEDMARGREFCEIAWHDMQLYHSLYNKAIACFQEVLHSDPQNVEALINLGAALSDTGRHKEALLYLNQAEELGSDDRNLFYNKAVTMMNINQSTRLEAPKYFKIAFTKMKSENTLEAYFDPQAH